MIRQIRTNLGKKQYWEESELTVLNGFEENFAVCLYPQYEDQTFLGFGGAFTEAAAYTWKNRKRSWSASQQGYRCTPTKVRCCSRVLPYLSNRAVIRSKMNGH